MKAVRMKAYGGSEVVAYEEAPVPEVGNGELLVRVKAASVNPADWKVREGYLKHIIPLELPIVMGIDFSGKVESLGAGVSGWMIGDEVFGSSSFDRLGAFAEFVAVPVAAVAKKPKSLSHEVAACIPTAGRSAWTALFDESAINLKRGQTVLIHGGAGGVGSFAIQFAKRAGARVIATGSTRSQDYLKAIGADVTIDYTQQSFAELTGSVDAVLDNVGGATLDASWAVVKRGGVLASMVQPPSEEAAQKHGVRAMMVYGAAPLAPIAEMVSTEKIKVLVSAKYPMADAAQALELSRDGHIRGKIVLVI